MARHARHALVEQRGMDALSPGAVFLGKIPVQLQQHPQLAHLLRRDPRDRHLPVGDQRPQMTGIGLVGLGSALRAAQGRGLGRLSQQRGDPRPLQLLHHEQPPRAALHRETHIIAAREPLLQPAAQRHPARRLDPAPPHLPGHGVQIVEGDLSTVDVKPSYDGHYRDLLTLLKLLTHQACAELRGSRLMSSLRRARPLLGDENRALHRSLHIAPVMRERATPGTEVIRMLAAGRNWQRAGQ